MNVIFTNILPPMYLWTRKNWLNFASHPLPHPGIVWRLLQHCKVGHFSTVWLVSLDQPIGLHEDFIVDMSLNKEVPVKVIQIRGADAESGSVSGLQMQTRFAFAEMIDLHSASTRDIYFLWSTLSFTKMTTDIVGPFGSALRLLEMFVVGIQHLTSLLFYSEARFSVLWFTVRFRFRILSFCWFILRIRKSSELDGSWTDKGIWPKAYTNA